MTHILTHNSEERRKNYSSQQELPLANSQQVVDVAKQLFVVYHSSEEFHKHIFFFIEYIQCYNYNNIMVQNISF